LDWALESQKLGGNEGEGKKNMLRKSTIIEGEEILFWQKKPQGELAGNQTQRQKKNITQEVTRRYLIGPFMQKEERNQKSGVGKPKRPAAFIGVRGLKKKKNQGGGS